MTYCSGSTLLMKDARPLATSDSVRDQYGNRLSVTVGECVECGYTVMGTIFEPNRAIMHAPKPVYRQGTYQVALTMNVSIPIFWSDEEVPRFSEAMRRTLEAAALEWQLPVADAVLLSVTTDDGKVDYFE